MAIATPGIDIGKNTFHLFDTDKKGNKVIRKRLSRKNLMEFIVNLTHCLIAMEVCGGAHHPGRIFTSYGHTVKLIPPAFVKPYVKSSRNDYNDAKVICKAAILQGNALIIRIQGRSFWITLRFPTRELASRILPSDYRNQAAKNYDIDINWQLSMRAAILEKAVYKVC